MLGLKIRLSSDIQTSILCLKYEKVSISTLVNSNRHSDANTTSNF